MMYLFINSQQYYALGCGISRKNSDNYKTLKYISKTTNKRNLLAKKRNRKLKNKSLKKEFCLSEVSKQKMIYGLFV